VAMNNSRTLYPAIEPYAQGMLDVGDGNRIYWETRGNPAGKPAVAVHGGPGSGCTPWWGRLFDPGAYRIVLFDQRNCGRSEPPASDPSTDLSANTTPHLIADMERLREHLGIERWLVLGGSWGSTLGLAYAEAHPEQVSELVLFGVTTGRYAELDWLFRGGVAALFPEQWERLRALAPVDTPDRDIAAVYNRMLNDSDPGVRRSAAEAWCLWESATPTWPPTGELSPRFRDPVFAYAFARIVTHYVSHDLWLEDGALMRGAGALAGVPGALIQGRFDFQAPLGNAWALHRVWPRAELVVVDNAGHSADTPDLTQEIIRATDRFAGTGR
jgi:proline iminopeptidase